MFLAALLARKSRRGHRARSACCPKCSSIAAVYQRYGISESLRARQGRCVKKVRAKSWPHLDFLGLPLLRVPEVRVGGLLRDRDRPALFPPARDLVEGFVATESALVLSRSSTVTRAFRCSSSAWVLFNSAIRPARSARSVSRSFDKPAR